MNQRILNQGQWHNLLNLSLFFTKSLRSADALDKFIDKLKDTGYKVRAFIHCNPSNPLGDVYNEETTLSLMKVCKKHQMHFISDEIYALSIFKNTGRQKFKRQVSKKFQTFLNNSKIILPDQSFQNLVFCHLMMFLILKGHIFCGALVRILVLRHFDMEFFTPGTKIWWKSWKECAYTQVFR